MNIDNIEVKRGDSFSRTLTFTSGVTPINLTGSVIKMTLKSRCEDVANVLQKTAVLTNAAGGIATISLTAGETDIATGNYYYDIEWTDGNGTVVTFIEGFFVITA